MSITYIPAAYKRLIKVVRYSGLDESNVPILEISDELAVAWQLEKVSDELTVKPIISGYQSDSINICLVVVNKDDTATCRGRQYRNFSTFLSFYKDKICHLENLKKSAEVDKDLPF